jgi:hypothetical protein
VTTDQLWAAFLLTLALFSAWRIYASVDSGKWKITYLRDLTIDRRAHPIAFWTGMTCQLFAMIVLLFLGAYILGPSILSAL